MSSTSDPLQKILERIDAQSVRAVAEALAQRYSFGTEAGISLTEIVEAFIGDADLGDAAERWSAHLRIRQAILDVVAISPDMSYVEGDA